MVKHWLINLFSYDGLLPATVVAIPAALFYLGFPLIVIDLTAIFLPIAAYFYRLTAGLRTIGSNACSSWFRNVQRLLLLLALFPLAVVDAFMVVTWRIPRNGLGWGDLIIAMYIYMFYLALMLVVTFPGRIQRSNNENTHPSSTGGY